ncbi:GGDEF domain-containing protein [Alicyclobacillus fastidiosus]|uniref:GGDEF domain-containing protein n=1 Tax=Alicyclobacillus fastidiosus TaxID=392011 RepID=A0ABV5AJG3_9BACL|nr:GGDEF domain-containing protein [Alicyclobacillus fastidiosus]WEH08341.1 GGDEF domain-containing protein [Alicyclobacillus fastidiosus]
MSGSVQVNPVVDLDIAKCESEGQVFLNKGMPHGKSFNVTHTSAGLNDFRELLRSVGKLTRVSPTIIFESTGYYHKAEGILPFHPPRFPQCISEFQIANIVQSLLMSTHTGIQARFVYSVALPTVFLEQISVIEVFIVIFNLRKPKWFGGLWAVGTLFLVVSILFHQNIYPVLGQVPDGYFFASPSNDVGFTLLKTIVYNSCLITLVCVVVRGLRKQKHRKRWLYALSVGVYGVCLLNDSVLLQLHRTLYPTAWVGELIFLVMLWREIRWHMQEVYDRLNRDALTGAFSRSFGEFYLSQVLTKQNVGVFYADIDGFKETNDTYGHQAGDEVLQRLVKLVEPLMVMPNVLIRLGGD